ncbi:TetR/AcrR family transcriptional regulator [Alicyclobacillus fodiniaquatilis]|uniref:TetR/AcrR family transcriptional regulator n=1 Tax=Alicyclobacillus fodiniaquatilis TaxID=1661150 RepID=A0ABW4JHP1_9BACL
MADERKRGQELEVAILEAADEIIKNLGYEQLTFQNVAKQAETSRSVIYRRYETPIDLLRALVRYKLERALGGNMIDLFEENGSLRADLLAAIRLYHKFSEAVGPEVLSAMLFELSQKNQGSQRWVKQAREGNIELMKKIQEFASQRGEINHEFSTLQMTLPFDLLRLEYIINSGNVTDEYMTQLVDEVLLPIYLGKK